MPIPNPTPQMLARIIMQQRMGAEFPFRNAAGFLGNPDPNMVPPSQPAPNGAGPGYMSPAAVAAGGKIPVRQKSGNISTEKTITFENDGAHYVVPTIINGVSYTPQQAMQMWGAGKNPHLGAFANPEEAKQFAEQRSMSLDKSFGGSGQLIKGPSDPAVGGLIGQ